MYTSEGVSTDNSRRFNVSVTQRSFNQPVDVMRVLSERQTELAPVLAATRRRGEMVMRMANNAS